MLLKIAHICFCSEGFNSETVLQKLGYRQLFESRVVPMKITQSLLSKRVDNFQMSFWVLPGNVSIELLTFEQYASNTGSIQPIFSGRKNSCFLLDKQSIVLLNNRKYHTGRFLDFPILFDSLGQDTPFCFNSMVLETIDLDLSISFWKVLGFNCVERLRDHVCMEFKCILTRQVFCVYLKQGGNGPTEPEEINSLGFHVLGFFSNSAAVEQNKIQKADYKTTAIEQIELNKNKMNIFYARSPEGVVLEIISII